jgi:hypothetical protein
MAFVGTGAGSNRSRLATALRPGAVFAARRRRRRRGRHRAFRNRDAIVAAFLRALPSRAFLLSYLLDQVWRAATWAWLRNDFIPACELALRITAASPENLAAPRAPLEHLALFTFGAMHSRLDRLGLELLDAVAIGIARASEELAEA